MFDSHCHLTASAFDDDRSEVVARAEGAGVTRMVTVASDVDDASACIELAESHESVWCSVGIHPHEAGSAPDGDLVRIRDLAEGSDRVVAIGETGLDFHYDHSPAKRQRDLFVAQLDLAQELGLPVIVHTRSADEDTLDILTDAPRHVRVVLHCFTGGDALLEAGLERGCYVSHGGIVTFKKFDSQAAVRTIPRNRLLVETDSPYLAPEPRRGRRNEPALLGHTVARLAEIRGESADDVAEFTAENAMRFYSLKAGNTSASQRQV